ncbi:MAG: D-alanyl-D-alanine carboxypeptidase/D-alanyl-D-alanine-endopeptidase [Gaiella sp.]
MRLRAVALLVVWLAASAAGLAAPAGHATETALRDRLRAALAAPGLAPGRTSALAIDLRSDQVLFAHNGRRGVAPASNEKVPVAWAALVHLGPNHRFATEVVADGERRGGVVDGDLVLVGNGDPTLDADDIRALARMVRAAGIRTVTGRIRGDESAFDLRRAGPAWKAGFLGLESPALSALVVDRAKGWPGLSPPLLAARALREALAEVGVTAGRPGLGKAPDGVEPLAVHRSAPLSAILQPMLADSDNFTAEMLLKTLGTVSGRRGTSAAGAGIVMSTMEEAGVPMAGVAIVDGSGLSSDNRLTAEALVGVYRIALADDEIRPVFLAALARPGREGTMEQRIPELRKRVRAKTGTTRISCSLSGVVDGRYAFAVIETGNPVASWTARAAQDRFVQVLASLG